LAEIEARINKLPAFATLLAGEQSPTDIMLKLFDGFDTSPPESIALSFRCNCSRQQVAGVLKNLGRQELADLAEKG
ncbi:MAG: Hsp33 family molecular chaperone HslO, partial [Desulfuromonadales bacterium]|nr:Hsp33 family molecular chaperone HslO [Desulfuromonadales bacterium]